MGSIVLTLLAALVAGAVQYGLAERFGRHAWQRLVRGTRVVESPDGPYRGDAAVVPVPYDEAPAFVRGVACATFYVGQMFVPGLVLGLFGLLAMGLGLVSIPGLVVAARIWRVAPKLLAPDARTAEQAEAAARWAKVLNVPILALASLACVYGLFQSDDGWLVVGGPTAVYAVLSLVHAEALRKAAGLVRAAQEGTEASTHVQVRVEDRALAPAGESYRALGEPDEGAPNLAESASHTTLGA